MSEPNNQVQTPATPQPNAAAASASPPPAPSGAPVAASTEGVARPEFIPEPFWDATSGQVKADVFTRLGELEAFKANDDSRRAAAPETADGYKLQAPADLQLPEGMEWKFDEADPRLALGRQIAHQMGLDQAGFETQLLKPFIEFEAANAQAQATQLADMVRTQDESLGPKAAERRDAVKNFFAAAAGADSLATIEHMLPVAGFVTAMEKVMRRASGGVSSFNGAGREGGRAEMSEEEYAGMSPADRLVQARRANASAGAR